MLMTGLRMAAARCRREAHSTREWGRDGGGASVCVS